MQANPTGYRKLNTGKIFFILSLFILIYWLLSRFVDIYYFSFIGAVYEILWLPMILGLFILPVWSFILWVKEKFTARSFYPYSILIFITTILLVIFLK